MNEDDEVYDELTFTSDCDVVPDDVVDFDFDLGEHPPPTHEEGPDGSEWFEPGKRHRTRHSTPARGLEAYVRRIIHEDITPAENPLEIIALVTRHMDLELPLEPHEMRMSPGVLYELIQSASLPRVSSHEFPQLHGSSDARLILAIMMLGMKDPPLTVVFNVLRSATHGPFVPAIIRVAYCHYNGIGTPRDPLCALHILRQVYVFSKDREIGKNGCIGDHVLEFMHDLKITNITFADGRTMAMEDVVIKHSNDPRVRSCGAIVRAADRILQRFDWPPMRMQQFFSGCE